MREMAHVLLAFGTNLGARMENLREALRKVARVASPTRASSIYETEPWGVQAQPRFLNMVLAGETTLSPDALLRALKTIEQEMGRVHDVRYGPRPIDLDILFYGALVLHTADLEIPHPRIPERRFVLVPLVELEPNLIHPILKRTSRELLAALPDANGEQLYAPALNLMDAHSNS